MICNKKQIKFFSKAYTFLSGLEIHLELQAWLLFVTPSHKDSNVSIGLVSRYSIGGLEESTHFSKRAGSPETCPEMHGHMW